MSVDSILARIHRIIVGKGCYGKEETNEGEESFHSIIQCFPDI